MSLVRDRMEMDMSKGRKRADAERAAPGVSVTVMTIRVIGDSGAAISAFRRAGELVESELLGRCDTAWHIEEEQ